MRARLPAWLSSRPVRLASGPLAGALAMAMVPAGQQPLMPFAAALAAWMAVWWVTEALPLAVTALLPLLLLPALGVTSTEAVAAKYMNSTVFLLLGGFTIALAAEATGLHRRVAYLVLNQARGSRARLLWGFLVTGALISMWMSNTAVAILMAPIALAVISRLERDGAGKGIAAAIALAVAWGASIGGIGTPVGSPPNLIFMQQYHLALPDAQAVTFLEWTALCAPLMLVMLAVGQAILWLLLCRGDKTAARQGCPVLQTGEQLGRLGRDELLVALVFCLTVLLWFFRAPLHLGAIEVPGWGVVFAGRGGQMLVDDGTVAILACMLLFMLPSASRPGKALLSWDEAKRLPWSTVLMFGGGFALAEGLMVSGFSEWCGSQLGRLSGLGTGGLLLSGYLFTSLLGELASNTAIAQIVLPIAAAASHAVNLAPALLMLPIALASSLDFILPAATPPNAIALATGKVTVRQMIGVGLVMELACAALVVLAMLYWAPIALRI